MARRAAGAVAAAAVDVTGTTAALCVPWRWLPLLA